MSGAQALAKELAGSLSVAESGLQESASHVALREQLELQQYEAEKMVTWFRNALQACTKKPAPFEDVQQYADWTARLALVRDRLERFGWSR